MPQNDSFIFLNSISAGTIVIGFFYLIAYLEIFPQLFAKEFFNIKFTEPNIFKFNLFRQLKNFIILNNLFNY